MAEAGSNIQAIRFQFVWRSHTVSQNLAALKDASEYASLYGGDHYESCE